MFNHPRNFTVFQPILNGQTLPWSSNTKYLGVTVDQNLNFSVHVKNMVQRVTSIWGILYPILNHQKAALQSKAIKSAPYSRSHSTFATKPYLTPPDKLPSVKTSVKTQKHPFIAIPSPNTII